MPLFKNKGQKTKMWTFLIVILSLSALTTAQDDPFKREITLKVKDQLTKSFQIKRPDNFKAGIFSCVITSRLVQGGKHVNMAVLYGGQSESWNLNSLGDNTTTTLCHETSDHFIIGPRPSQGLKTSNA